MDILLIVGASGSGKSTITSALSKYDEFMEIMSYTDRPKRYEDEDTHIFLSKKQMDSIINTYDIVAYTEINGYRYCALERQFNKKKINIYIVDNKGIKDVFDYFSNIDCNIYVVFIIRDVIDVDVYRIKRDVELPPVELCDLCVFNNGSVGKSVNQIKDYCKEKGIL